MTSPTQIMRPATALQDSSSRGDFRFAIQGYLPEGGMGPNGVVFFQRIVGHGLHRAQGVKPISIQDIFSEGAIETFYRGNSAVFVIRADEPNGAILLTRSPVSRLRSGVFDLLFSCWLFLRFEM